MEDGAAPPPPPHPRRPRPPLDDPPRPPLAGGGNQFGLKPISRGISLSDRLSVHAPAIGDASCAAPPARVATAVVRIRTSDRCMPYYAKGPRRRKRPSQGGLRNNSETFVSDTFVPGVIERPRRRNGIGPSPERIARRKGQPAPSSAGSPPPTRDLQRWTPRLVHGASALRRERVRTRGRHDWNVPSGKSRCVGSGGGRTRAGTQPTNGPRRPN